MRQCRRDAGGARRGAGEALAAAAAGGGRGRRRRMGGSSGWRRCGATRPAPSRGGGGGAPPCPLAARHAPHRENECVHHGAEPEQAEQLVDDEAEHRDEVEREHDDAADEQRQDRMGERHRAARPEAAPSEPGEHHGLAEQPGAKQPQHHERNCGNADHRDTQQHEKDGREQHGEQCGENGHARDESRASARTA